MAEYNVGYLPQTTDNTCWAASTAMLVNFVQGTSYGDMDIVAAMEAADGEGTYRDGATQPELRHVAEVFRFNQIYPVCQDVNGWAEWLDSYGPLLIQVPGNAYHSIVIAAVRTDQCPEFHVLDPWNGELWLDFDDLNSRYELAGAGWENNVYSTR